MTNIIENPEVFPSVPLLGVGTKVKGGDEEAPSNIQAVALAARTAFLKAQLDAMETHGLYVIGTLATQAELDAIDTDLLGKGDGYFVEGTLTLWNGQRWVSSGSLVGKPGEAGRPGDKGDKGEPGLPGLPGKDGVGANEVSSDPGNALSLGEDGKLYAPNDLTVDLLSVYHSAKE